jgi:LysM repeat protein
VVLAWMILPVWWVTAALATPHHPGPASTRTAAISTISSSSTKLIRTSTVTAAPTRTASPAPRHAGHPAARYAVQPGDTLSAIATRLALPGGWPALYAANRKAIGPNPGLIRPGTRLRLPPLRVPARYRVATGDTLSGIAARYAVRGGWPALYAANRKAIGPNPDTIDPGTVLRLPQPTRVSSPGPPSHPHPAPAPPPPGGTPHHSQPIPAVTSAATGMPRWLKIILASVGLLVLAALAAEPLLHTASRRRRPPPAVAAGSSGAAPPPEPDHQPAPASLPLPVRPRRARIILADHDRLVVTRSARDGTVYVLRPPGEDPQAILRVARLVLPEGPYGELARQLGVPAIRQVI